MISSGTRQGEGRWIERLVACIAVDEDDTRMTALRAEKMRTVNVSRITRETGVTMPGIIEYADVEPISHTHMRNPRTFRSHHLDEGIIHLSSRSMTPNFSSRGIIVAIGQGLNNAFNHEGGNIITVSGNVNCTRENVFGFPRGEKALPFHASAWILSWADISISWSIILRRDPNWTNFFDRAWIEHAETSSVLIIFPSWNGKNLVKKWE